MSPGPAWRRYLTFWRTSVDRDVDAELRFHFEERIADLVARGSTPAEARDQAVREFGDPGEYRARLREIGQRLQARRGRREWLDVVTADVRYSLRAMGRAPGLTAAVVVTLALGIGANGAIFSMLDRIFLRPPPGLAAPDALRRFYGDYESAPPMPGFVRQSFNYAEISDMTDALGPRQPLTGFTATVMRMGVTDEAPEANVVDVVGDYFGVLGVRPWRGRLFAPEELEVTSPHLVAVVSHRFWKRQLGGDTAIIGKPIQIGRRGFIVIGIAPPGFDGTELDAVDVWRPANARSTGTANPPWYQARNSSNFFVITRLAPEATDVLVAQMANNGLHRSDDRLASRTTVSVGPIIEARGPSTEMKEATLTTRLGGVTLIVLLIAVANVANLLLTRAIQRRREIAVRVALGVSRARLAAQLITESTVLAILAGAVALVVATWGAVLIRFLLLPQIRWADGPLDLRLATFTFAVALAAGLVAGLLPFARAGQLDLAAAMRGGARDGGAHRSRVRGALIVMQAALSVVLLAGAALFVHSLRAVRGLDLGYDIRGVVTATVASGQRVISRAEREAGLVAIRDRAARIPGVREAALTNIPPLAGLSSEMMYFPGRDSMPRTAGGPPTFTAVTPGFFKATGVAMLSGRSFTAEDREGAPPVMIVTRTMARLVWPNANPLGQCVRIVLPTAPCTTVVGVTEDVRRDKVVEEEMLLYYLPLAQAPSRSPYSLVVGADPAELPRVMNELRAIVRQVLPGSRADIGTFEEQLAPQYRPWGIGAGLFSLFGLLALVVAGIGIYSAIAYSVMQRSHELGIRIALGAQRVDIGRIVVGSGVRLVGGGVLIGVAAALVLGRLIESLLFETNSRDPIVLASVSATLLCVAIVAAALPAWRASRLDPVKALRAE